ncbi:hypothetical protein BC938DRAFT_475976 [Jimgerdemannia flammicorona]|uniref:Uncharacterized protein n=1 Tax=Jimgerdemannia flammicorona TaxID=994334 RepID=A0A433QR33_9FUNG|nr:hypothetical protein BC938DRAFT_475976 [Jimgerdemannia flammicorona]
MRGGVRAVLRWLIGPEMRMNRGELMQRGRLTGVDQDTDAILEDRVEGAVIPALALLPHVIQVLPRLLVGLNVILVALGRGGEAREDILRVVAVLNKARAGRVGVAHSATGTLVEHGAISRVAPHLRVVLVLHIRIRQSVADQQGGKVHGLEC